MPLDVREVHHVATLARLRLEAEEERCFAEQLSKVVDYIDQIRSVAAAAPHADPPPPGREADDDESPCLARESFLANAPASEGPFLLVPRVLGGDDA